VHKLETITDYSNNPSVERYDIFVTPFSNVQVEYPLEIRFVDLRDSMH